MSDTRMWEGTQVSLKLYLDLLHAQKSGSQRPFRILEFVCQAPTGMKTPEERENWAASQIKKQKRQASSQGSVF